MTHPAYLKALSTLADSIPVFETTQHEIEYESERQNADLGNQFDGMNIALAKNPHTPESHFHRIRTSWHVPVRVEDKLRTLGYSKVRNQYNDGWEWKR